MKKARDAVEISGLTVIVILTIAGLCMLAVEFSLGPVAFGGAPVAFGGAHFADWTEDQMRTLEKAGTWGPWTQADSCPWQSNAPEWRPAKVRSGRTVLDRFEKTVWQVEGQPNRIYETYIPRLGAFLWGGGATAGMGILLGCLWSKITICLGNDRSASKKCANGPVTRTRANACAVMLHCAAVVMGLMGITLLWQMVPSGKGFWFVRTHTGGLWLVAVLANAAVGYWALIRKRQSAPLMATSVLTLLAMVLAALQALGVVDL